MIAEGLICGLNLSAPVFRYINKLGFIFYSDIVCNFSNIHSKTFSFVIFFPQRFLRKSGVFSLFRISLLCH